MQSFKEVCEFSYLCEVCGIRSVEFFEWFDMNNLDEPAVKVLRVKDKPHTAMNDAQKLE
ncbi:MAG: hypothetical protein ACYC9O_10875 [Candidatus Latescibacterota bacterium]